MLPEASRLNHCGEMIYIIPDVNILGRDGPLGRYRHYFLSFFERLHRFGEYLLSDE